MTFPFNRDKTTSNFLSLVALLKSFLGFNRPHWICCGGSLNRLILRRDYYYWFHIKPGYGVTHCVANFMFPYLTAITLNHTCAFVCFPSVGEIFMVAVKSQKFVTRPYKINAASAICVQTNSFVLVFVMCCCQIKGPKPATRLAFKSIFEPLRNSLVPLHCLYTMPR